MTKLKPHQINPLSASQKAGRCSNDVEVLVGTIWTIATSIAVTFRGSLFWKTEWFNGNNPENTWRWIA